MTHSLYRGSLWAVYSAMITGLVPPASATDIFTIAGGSTAKVTRVLRIEVAGVATALTVADILIVKRSTLDTAGTFTNPTAVPNDSTIAPAQAILAAYTSNPTLGTAVGTVRAKKFILGTATAQGLYPAVFEFGPRDSQRIALRNTTEQLCVNLNVQTIAGNSIDIAIEWSEDLS